MLSLYGHPFSSYTWKALIALYTNETPFTFMMLGPEEHENGTLVQTSGPQGKFPVLTDGKQRIFEATSIIEFLDVHHPGKERFIPEDPDAALGVRTLDRVFDNYVMNIMQIVVNEYLRDAANPDLIRCAEARTQLDRTYAWLEGWLSTYPQEGQITLIECAAAPSLFYADWVNPIAGRFPRLEAWRTHLLALPPVKRCVDDARPFRAYFPLGAPDRD